MRRLALMLCIAAACGGGTGGSVPIGSLEGELIKSYCDLFVRCGLFADTSSCLDLNLDIHLNDDLIAAVNAGKVVYHADKARECLDAFSAKSCARTDFIGSRSQPAACEETFSGTVGDGGACALNEECISQQCNIAPCSMACCQGTCMGATAPVRPKLGESCANDTNCVDSYCDGMSSICTAYLQAGTACTSTTQCADGLACLGSPQVCTALVAAGGACTSTSQCSDINDTCSQTSMTCIAGGLPGAMCQSNADCVSGPYLCDTTTHKCAFKPRLGEACTTSCIDNSYCDSTTMKCTAPQPDGATCDPTKSSAQCTSGTCDSTTMKCVTPPVCI